jgi:iron complex outermembrane receptor protein
MRVSYHSRAIAASLLALSAALATPALAQTAEAVAPEGEEIIVTATRTESLASKTPIALTAVQGSALQQQGIGDVQALANVVPNINIFSTGTTTQITMRGVTSNDNSEKGDPSAAVLIDGVYLARQQLVNVSLYDMERVEVLRGPQGTLYGRNSTAGVINNITRKPVFRTEASANLSIGNFDARRLEAMVNLPLSDIVAVRIAGVYDQMDSTYIKGDTTSPHDYDPGRKNYSGRLSVLAEPSDNLTAIVRFDYSKMKGAPLGNPISGYVLASRFYDLAVPAAGSGDYLLLKQKDISSQDARTITLPPAQQPSQDSDTWGVTGELSWDVGPVTATYLGSYREFDRNEFGLRPGTNGVQYIVGRYDQISQELRLSLNDIDRLTAQAGVYWFKEDSRTALWIKNFFGPNSWLGFPHETKSESLGLFGQATYEVLPALRLTLGGRFNKDKKSRLGGSDRRNLDVLTGDLLSPQTPFPANCRVSGTPQLPEGCTRLNYAAREDEQFTWRVGLDYDVNAATMVYGSIATGYKAGGFGDGCIAGTVVDGITCNNATAPDRLYYDPEELIAYELGIKTRLLDRRLALNASLFFYDFKNMQLSALRTDADGNSALVTTNAGKARIKGAELETVFTPSQAHRLEFNATWLDATYSEYIAGNAATDFSGRSLDRSPEFEITAAYTYTHELPDESTIAARVGTRWTDSYVLTGFTQPVQFEQPSFTKTDASLTYTAPGGRYTLGAFIRNIEDKVVLTSIGVNAPLANSTVNVSEPRTYGVRMGVRF